MKTRIIFSIALLGLGLSGFGQAPSEARPDSQEQKKPAARELSAQQERIRQRLATQTFNMLDTNRDGFIDVDEFRAMVPKYFFRRLDINGDGKIDKEEWLDAKGGGGRFQGLRRYREFFMADKDLDGQLSRSEYNGSIFDKLDLNHDGYLSLDEWKRRNWEETNHKIEEALRKYDRNHDGKVTRSEFSGKAEEFDLLDTDMDAEITRADVRR